MHHLGRVIQGRYNDTDRVDYDFKCAHVFLGTFEDDTRIVPVKLEVIESNSNPNNLYVVITMGEIEKQDEFGQNKKTTNVIENPESLKNEVPKFSAVDRTYSIPWLIEKINPKDGVERCTILGGSFKSSFDSLFVSKALTFKAFLITFGI